MAAVDSFLTSVSALNVRERADLGERGSDVFIHAVCEESC
jgi:hypothetical protein